MINAKLYYKPSVERKCDMTKAFSVYFDSINYFHNLNRNALYTYIECFWFIF